jgi:hypothetical protein
MDPSRWSRDGQAGLPNATALDVGMVQQVFRAGPTALLDCLSVCTLNSLKLGSRKAGSPKNLENQVSLAIDVAVDVVPKLSREPLLEVTVLPRSFGMRSQVIPNRQLIRETEADARKMTTL